MPELPDLQVFSRNLDKKLSGKKLKKIEVRVEKKLTVPVKTLKKALEGATLDKVYREGKELHFAFDNGQVLGLHLMLHGNLYFFDKKHEQKSPIIELHFNDGTGLVMTDFQRQATPTLNPEKRDEPDAMSKALTAKKLATILQRKTMIKTLLLDQHVIRGIGNAYADEILWDARISPFSMAEKIPAAKIKALAKSIKSVLTWAEKQIHKKEPGIISGEIRDFMKIHHAKKKESPTGRPIQQKLINSRKTYFTDEQELFD